MTNSSHETTEGRSYGIPIYSVSASTKLVAAVAVAAIVFATKKFIVPTDGPSKFVALSVGYMSLVFVIYYAWTLFEKFMTRSLLSQ